MKTLIGTLVVVIMASFAFKPATMSTKLKITILNELGNIEDSVAVTLYRDESDYREEVNPVTQIQYTDAKGRTTFTDLDPVAYYIHAEKGDKTNVGAGVVTDILLKGKLNKLNIVIE